jgi:pyrimidine-nucleoside phosphorylase
MYDLIQRKKHGEEMTREEIFSLISRYTEGEIPDYQMSALLMAICFRGMTDEEIFALTEAMVASGDAVDLSDLGDGTVDKHSTGGVGDKTTLIVAPIVAAAGGTVAKMSGRGLGHTGGTVDKLESFAGFRTALCPEEFKAQVEKCGIAVIGQSANLAPADKKLYALRDTTATVDSVPLIASSIMSKKLAAGTRSIVLDVKYGSGAFMHSPKDAEALAQTMVKIGAANGRRTAAVITNMDVPLGCAVGNALEVAEAIEVLKGKGPSDLCTVCLTLASFMIELSCRIPREQAEARARTVLESGAAYEKFCEWITEQGGDAAYARDPSLFGEATYKRDILAQEDGFIAATDAEMIGSAAMLLGAGRATLDAKIDPLAGILLFKKTADRVRKGEVLASLYTERRETLNEAEALVRRSLRFTDTEIPRPALIYATV